MRTDGDGYSLTNLRNMLELLHDDAFRGELRADLDRCMKLLPDKMRWALILRSAGYSYRENRVMLAQHFGTARNAKDICQAAEGRLLALLNGEKTHENRGSRTQVRRQNVTRLLPLAA